MSNIDGGVGTGTAVLAYMNLLLRPANKYIIDKIQKNIIIIIFLKNK
jgi:hypothetical protein